MGAHERLIELDLAEVLSGRRPPDLTDRALAQLMAAEDCRTVPAGPEHRPHAVSDSAGALPANEPGTWLPPFRRVAELALVCGVLGLCAWLLWPEADSPAVVPDSGQSPAANGPMPEPSPLPPVSPLRQWALQGVRLQGVFVLDSEVECTRLVYGWKPRDIDWSNHMLVVAAAPVGQGASWSCELQPRESRIAHLEIVAQQAPGQEGLLSAAVFELPRAEYEFSARVTMRRSGQPELMVNTPVWRLLEVALGIGTGTADRRAELVRKPADWARLLTAGELPGGTRLARPVSQLAGTAGKVDDDWADTDHDILAVCAGEYPASLWGHLLYEGVPGRRRLTFWKEAMGDAPPSGILLLVKLPRESGTLIVDLYGNEPATNPPQLIEIQR